jgi:hypothetical protein
MTKSQVFVGIDVAQATLEVAVRPGDEAWQVANDEIAFADLARGPNSRAGRRGAARNCLKTQVRANLRSIRRPIAA